MLIQIKEVLLGDKILQKKDIGIAVVQMMSPFYNELKVIRGDAYPILGWDEKAFEKRRNRIGRILSNISRLDRSVDFLIFPEYAVHQSMLDMFYEYSDKYECICLVNYYEVNKRANITKIIFPNKYLNGEREFDQYKLLPSDGDVDLLRKTDALFDRASVENCFYRFFWDKKVGKESIRHYFQVFNCIDYLQFSNDYVDMENPGLIFIPACTNGVSEFYAIGDLLLRKSLVGVAKKSLISVFCNNSHMIGADDVGKGGSCIIASKSKQASVLMDSSKECVLIADTNCLTQKVQPTLIGAANTSINSVVMLEVDENADLIEYEPSGKSLPVINPNIFNELRLNRYYFLYRSASYVKLKKLLKDLTVGSAGIFGFHDILIKARDESYQYVLLRISQTMKKNKSGFDVEGPEVFRVIEQLKFRGLIKSEIELGKGVNYFYLRNEIDQIKKLFFGCNIELSKYSEYIGKRVFLKDIYPDDLTEVDEKNGYSEFHVYLILRNNRYDSSADIRSVFEDKVLKYLYENQKVKTIEAIEAEKTKVRSQISEASYILHIVGSVKDAKDVVVRLSEIYDAIDGYTCQTRVVPIAEIISDDKFECLFETITNTNPHDAEVIWRIISNNMVNQKPFLIKRLSSEQMHEIAELYHLCNSWSCVLDQKLGDSAYSEVFMKSFDDFVYGVSLFMIGNECQTNIGGKNLITDADKEQLYLYTHQLVRGVAVYYERVLKQIIRESCSKFGGVEGMVVTVEDLKKINRNKLRPKIENLDLKKCSMGDLINIVVFFNNHLYEKSVDSSILKKLNESMGFSHYRNCYSHAADVENQGDVKGIGRVLDCIKDRGEPMRIVMAIQNVLRILVHIYNDN